MPITPKRVRKKKEAVKNSNKSATEPHYNEFAIFFVVKYHKMRRKQSKQHIYCDEFIVFI